MARSSVRALLEQLREDRWRSTHPFSADLEDAHAVLHRPYATPSQKIEAVLEWCQKRQPCLFGKIAARAGAIHVCVLDDLDLTRGDESIRRKIAEDQRIWKQRALNARGFEPPHSFVLVVSSRRVAEAAPDGELRRFAEHVRELAGWAPREQVATGGVTPDFLYLKNPEDGCHYGFRFNVDFFGAAGDGRWWHDHRFPGGIAFTANAAGHMKAWLEWYHQPGSDQSGWMVQQAMMTICNAEPMRDAKGRAQGKEGTAGALPIDGAVPTADSSPSTRPKPGWPDPEGRITWLRPMLSDGPLKPISCPMKKVPKKLEGMDWTTYEGVVHTDHSVRREFFDGRDEPVTAVKPYLMDFKYLFDPAQADFAEFSGGIPVEAERIYTELGHPETWVYRSREAEAEREAPTHAQQVEIDIALERCRAWAPLGEQPDNLP